MFLLNDANIRRYIERGDLAIGDVHWKGLGPTSYRFRLYDKYEVMFAGASEHGVINHESGTLLKPDTVYRIKSLETFRVSQRVQGFISPTTNFTLKGIELLHGFGVDPGFEGQLDFLLRVIGRVPRIVFPGEEIAKIYFYDITDTYGPHSDEQKAYLESLMAERKKILTP